MRKRKLWFLLVSVFEELKVSLCTDQWAASPQKRSVMIGGENGNFSRA